MSSGSAASHGRAKLAQGKAGCALGSGKKGNGSTASAIFGGCACRLISQ